MMKTPSHSEVRLINQNPFDVNHVNPLIKSIPGYLYWKDMHGIYLGCNDNFLRLTGLANVVGKTDVDMPWAKEAQHIQHREQDVIRLNKNIESEEHLCLANGDAIILLTHTSPFQDEEGKTLGVICTAIDITARKQQELELKHHNEQSELTISTIVANMPGHVYWKDLHGVYLGCNLLQAQSLGFDSPQQIIGKTDSELPFKTHHAAQYQQNDRRIMTKGQEEMVEEESHLAGQDKIVLSHKTPMYNAQGDIIGILGISLDISDRKKMEAELHQAKIAAEAANHAKTEFIANMSHDIRTPLTGVIGLSQRLQQGLTHPEQRQEAQWIHESGKQLLSLLNGVLDVITADNVNEKDIHVETFDIRASVNALGALVMPSVKVKKLDLKLMIDESVPDYLWGDRTKIERIMLNLIGNAVKFTKEGYVAIKINPLIINNDSVMLRFYIEDTGVGIPKDAQAHVFDRFYHVKSSAQTTQKGHGIGLHIAHKYVELLGGEKINLTSQVGKGSVFYFDLPIKIGQEKDLPKRSTSLDSKKTAINLTPKPLTLNSYKPHVLIAEDDPIALHYVEKLIEKLECPFMSTKDGLEAFHLATTTQFDLILTDVNLPGMSGLEISRRLREWETLHQKEALPIIGLSGYSKKELNQEYIESGMTDLLTKPLSEDILCSLIEQYSLRSPTNAENENKEGSAMNGELRKTATPGNLGFELPDKEEELFQLNSYPLLDKDLALKNTNDEHLINELLSMMTNEDIPVFKQDMNDAYLQQDWQKIEKIAHKMKGSSSYCCTTKLGMACQYLERYLKAGHTQLADKLYEQSLQVGDETLKFLQKNNLISETGH